MAQSQLEKDVECHKCWYMLEFTDSKQWPDICPVCGRRKPELLELENRYYDEAE